MFISHNLDSNDQLTNNLKKLAADTGKLFSHLKSSLDISLSKFMLSMMLISLM